MSLYDDILAAKRKLYDSYPEVCGVTRPHVVHPRQGPGWVICADCFCPFELKEAPCTSTERS
jgi:hypothetical protein